MVYVYTLFLEVKGQITREYFIKILRKVLNTVVDLCSISSLFFLKLIQKHLIFNSLTVGRVQQE